MIQRANSRAARALLLTSSLAAVVAACLPYPQRLPGPLFVPGTGTPAGAAIDPGPLQATVQRDSAPVWVRRPGQRADYALPFYRKRERLPCGTMVRTGAGGGQATRVLIR